MGDLVDGGLHSIARYALSPALVLMLCLAGLVHAGAPESPQQRFQHVLDQATHLNTTAPWQESQALLEVLRPDLAHANDYQTAEFHWLEARNLALAGDLGGSLSALTAIKTLPLAPEQRLRTYRLAANVALIARRFDEAFAYLNTGLRMVSEENLHLHAESLYSLASHAYTLVGEIEQGIIFGQLAVQLAEQLNSERHRCSSNQRLAFAFKSNGENENSLTHYRRALDYCLQANDLLIANIVRHGMADLLRQAGELEEAEALFLEALPGLETHGYRSGLAEGRLFHARLKMTQGEHDDAEHLLNLTLEPLLELEIWDYLAEAHERLGQIARARGDFQSAFRHHDQQVTANRRAHEAERSRRLTYLEVEFNLLHNKQQLALLEEQARVNQLEAAARLQQRQIRRFAYGLSALFMLALAALLFHTMRERRRYQTLSEIDGLTGALNHTRFFVVAEQEQRLAAQNNQSFWLLLADIDHFKRVNDQHGHLTGDNILRQVGRRLNRCFGAHGAIGRIGGEEFAVTLRGKDESEVNKLLRTFRNALTERARELNSPTITMSFGLALQLHPEEPLQQIRERADKALYQAKRAGRDRVVFLDQAVA